VVDFRIAGPIHPKIEKRISASNYEAQTVIVWREGCELFFQIHPTIRPGRLFDKWPYNIQARLELRCLVPLELNPLKYVNRNA